MHWYRCRYHHQHGAHASITEVSEELVHKAQRQSGEEVTGTVRQGLELVAAAEAYRKLAALRGKVKFSIDLETMREDRE